MGACSRRGKDDEVISHQVGWDCRTHGRCLSCRPCSLLLSVLLGACSPAVPALLLLLALGNGPGLPCDIEQLGRGTDGSSGDSFSLLPSPLSVSQTFYLGFVKPDCMQIQIKISSKGFT